MRWPSASGSRAGRWSRHKSFGKTAMLVVVDASAAAAVIFDEPEGATIAAHVRDETLIAPPLIDYELANVAWSKIRRSPERRAEVLAALSTSKAMPITRAAVDITAVLELA